MSAATTRSRAPIWSTLRWKGRPYPWPRAPKNSRPVTATPIELPTCWAADSAPQPGAQRPGGEYPRVEQGHPAAVGLAPLVDGERDRERDGGERGTWARQASPGTAPRRAQPRARPARSTRL